MQGLEKDIRGWIKAWNEEPRPFIWVKTAYEILDRLTTYLNRIPDSGHLRPQQRISACPGSIGASGWLAEADFDCEAEFGLEGP